MNTTARRAAIIGTGSYLPERIVSNEELARTVETSDDWIVERTGIKARHVAADDEQTSDLATIAARRALEAAGIEPSGVGLIILATTTPDKTFPATAVQVQANLGIGDCVAFDVQAVCSGFVYALSIADAMLCRDPDLVTLVIGAETFTRLLDWDDRSTCVLFGDGAGAVVLQSRSDGSGILATRLHADGRHRDLLHVDGGPSSTGTVGKVRMKGRGVYRHAVVNLAAVLDEIAAAAGVGVREFDWIVPHQANLRILEGTAKKLGLDPERIVVTIDEHANTSAASVPLALDRAVRDGRGTDLGRGRHPVVDARSVRPMDRQNDRRARDR
jgi:3-oxoacyl-[acyl-carrier-protein] synthase-3